MNNGKIVFGIFVFIFFYTFMNTLIFGTNFLQSNPMPDFNSYFGINNVLNMVSSITGGMWVINFMGNTISFEFIHQIIIWILIPFAYIYQIFAFIISFFIWVGNMILYPFTYLPAPFSTFGELFISGLIIIEILFSIRILSSGLGGE
jgi:hypothetical protein